MFIEQRKRRRTTLASTKIITEKLSINDFPHLQHRETCLSLTTGAYPQNPPLAPAGPESESEIPFNWLTTGKYASPLLAATGPGPGVVPGVFLGSTHDGVEVCCVGLWYDPVALVGRGAAVVAVGLICLGGLS